MSSNPYYFFNTFLYDSQDILEGSTLLNFWNQVMCDRVDFTLKALDENVDLIDTKFFYDHYIKDKRGAGGLSLASKKST